ncbi:RNA-binding domain-containing protein [Piromyces finnis]|uniref:RNA-binding domain-containing protein n=1 Tax=Piromyces finnis TaxID=1754191 RepID=A0A1Y1VMG6_9FUNG|nr:RNA-binding domain-containing protein [Piromyces finnis]|eukprot:ORX59346.1 RNA-binding domain-containing protein [Piromyces finnis]
MFKFGSGGDVKVDPTLDSIFKNSVPVPPKVVPAETQQPKKEKVEKTEKKKNNENKKKEVKNEQPTPDTKKEDKKRKRDEETTETTETTETEVTEKKEKSEKELIEEQYRKQFVHEALKTEKAKKKNKEKKEKEKKKEEEEEELKPKKKRKVRDEPEKLERTLFVGNLDKNVTEKANLKKLKALFKKYGTIESIRFRSVAFSNNKPKKIAFITKEFHPERDCLNAYIVFENKESAEKAIELNGTLFNEKHMRVDLERTEKKLDEKKSVFVGNLAFDEQEEVLWKAFSDCGEVVNVRIVRDAKTNLGKGFGYVTFKERSSVALAMELNDTTVGKRKIRVFRCKNLKKKEEEANMMKEGEHAIKNKKIARLMKGPKTRKRWTHAQKKQNAIKKHKKLLKKAAKQNK